MEAPEKLKPCPFCGGEARIEDELEDGGKCISCIRCMACSPVYFDRCENMVPEWNRRDSTMPGELVEKMRAEGKWLIEQAMGSGDGNDLRVAYVIRDILALHEGRKG